MRFHCKTKHERLEAKIPKRKQWKRRFLWWPRRIAPGDRRWLEFYYEKEINPHVCSNGWGRAYADNYGSHRAYKGDNGYNEIKRGSNA